MPDSTPTIRKRRPAPKRSQPAVSLPMFWRAAVVLTVLVASLAFLFGRANQPASPSLDANGNPAVARYYGSFDAVRQ